MPDESQRNNTPAELDLEFSDEQPLNLEPKGDPLAKQQQGSFIAKESVPTSDSNHQLSIRQLEIKSKLAWYTMIVLTFSIAGVFAFFAIAPMERIQLAGEIFNFNALINTLATLASFALGTTAALRKQSGGRKKENNSDQNSEDML